MSERRRRVFVAASLALLAVGPACRSAGAAAVRAEPAPDHLQAGIDAFTRGQYAQAEAELRQASGPEASAYLAGALARQKKYAPAIESMGAAIAARGDLAYAYFWRGQAYYAKKQTDKMVGDFETFLRLAPKAPEAATVEQLLASLR